MDQLGRILDGVDTIVVGCSTHAYKEAHQVQAASGLVHHGHTVPAAGTASDTR